VTANAVRGPRQALMKDLTLICTDQYGTESWYETEPDNKGPRYIRCIKVTLEEKELAETKGEDPAE
jgi:hypothetical protein